MKKFYLFFACILFFCISLFSQIDEGFEGVFPPTGWQTHSGSSGNTNWMSSPNGRTGNAASFDNWNDNVPSVASTFYVLRCPVMDLTGSVSTELQFDVAYAPYNLPNFTDDLSIWYSVDTNQNNWTKIITYTNADTSNVSETTSKYVPSGDGDWSTITLDLSDNIYKQSWIRFAFEIAPAGITPGGNVMYIDNVRFTDIVLSTNSDREIADLILYPNPSTGNINIQVKGLNSCKIKVINTLGQHISDFDIHERSFGYELNLNQLPKGTYFVSIESDGQKTSKMIFLQ